MKVTPQVIQQEFIGKLVKIADSTNPVCRGLHGRVVDETRNTLTLSIDGKKKAIAKDSNVFHFGLSDGTVVEIEGRLLKGRPEDRLKKSIRRLW